MKPLLSPSSRAFSLVEVVLALGVLSFAVLIMLALLPMGLKTNRDTQEESMAVNIVGAMVADWKAVALTTNQSLIFDLPPLAPSMALTNTLGISESGQSTNLSAAMYRVSYHVTPPVPTNSFMPYYVDFTVLWPAQSTNAVGKIEFIAALPSQ